MTHYECVLKCGKPCNDTKTILPARWESIKEKSKKWTGLDKFGNVRLMAFCRLYVDDAVT